MKQTIEAFHRMIIFCLWVSSFISVFICEEKPMMLLKRLNSNSSSAHFWQAWGIKTQKQNNEDIKQEALGFQKWRLCRHLGSFFTLLNLLHLAGLIHHLSIDHRLGDDFHNLPGPHIRVFCSTELNRQQIVSLLVYFYGRLHQYQQM